MEAKRRKVRYRRCPQCHFVAPESAFIRRSYRRMYGVRRCPQCGHSPEPGMGLGGFPYAKAPKGARHEPDRS